MWSDGAVRDLSVFLFTALTLADSSTCILFLDEESHRGRALRRMVSVDTLHAHGRQRRGLLPVSHPLLRQPGPPVWRLAVRGPPHGDRQLFQVRPLPHTGAPPVCGQTGEGWEILLRAPSLFKREVAKDRDTYHIKLCDLQKEILNYKLDHKSKPVQYVHC